MGANQQLTNNPRALIFPIYRVTTPKSLRSFLFVRVYSHLLQLPQLSPLRENLDDDRNVFTLFLLRRIFYSIPNLTVPHLQ